MILVSQDKDVIINFDNIVNLVVINNTIVSIGNVEETTGITIAEYETEKRAKEVLKEIIKKVNNQKFLLKPKVKVKQETIEAAKAYFERINGIDLIVDDDNFEIIPIGNSAITIYEMPEKLRWNK